MQNYKEDHYFDQTGLPWVLPSPNMPTLETAIVYSGTVLFEGTNVSEGRGTTKPFELIGAPGTNNRELVQWLNTLQLPGVTFRPLIFTPTFHKFSNEQCHGLQLHITDPNVFHSTMTGAALLLGFRKFYANFEWLTPPYEYENKLMPIDILSGSATLRGLIDDQADFNDIQTWLRADEDNPV